MSARRKSTRAKTSAQSSTKGIDEQLFKLMVQREGGSEVEGIISLMCEYGYGGGGGDDSDSDSEEKSVKPGDFGSGSIESVWLLIQSLSAKHQKAFLDLMQA